MSNFVLRRATRKATLSLNATMPCKVKVPFVKGRHFTESSMVAHTDHGLVEMCVKCEGVGALILNTTVCYYSHRSFHSGTGPFKFSQLGLH